MPSPNDHSIGTPAAGGDSPHELLINRQLELDLLRQHIARVAETGKGHAVLILGESGVGKSRLAAEAAAVARNRWMAVISVRCLGRGAEPLLPLKEALASHLGRTPDQIRRTLARAAPQLLDAVPFIGAFLATVGEKLAEGSFSLRGVYEELSRILIRAASGNAGLFLLVDDLHAADPDTLYFLNYLFRKLQQVPVLAVATVQEEQLSDYPELADLMAEWPATGHVTLTVVPLERAHVGEYVRMMSATGEQADESIVDRVFRLTGGNPFLLREALSLITQSAGSPLAEDAGTRRQRPGDLHRLAHPLRHHPRPGHPQQSRARLRAGTSGHPTGGTGPFGGADHGLRPAVRPVPARSLRPCRAHRRRPDRLRLRRRARRTVGKPARRERPRYPPARSNSCPPVRDGHAARPPTTRP